MSLVTDKIFYSALKANSTLVQTVEGRIYNTAIPLPDDECLNEPVPYIIISFDGLGNTGYSKDNSYEGCTDEVKISIEVVANDREQLGELTTTIRQTVIDFFESDDHTQAELELIPNSYTFAASQVNYDADKPCYFQTLTYNCDTNP